MEKNFIFNGATYNTREKAEEAVFNYATETYDDMLDECNEEVKIGSLSYPVSYVFKRVDEIAYRCGLNDYADSLLYDIETEEVEPEEDEIDEER